VCSTEGTDSRIDQRDGGPRVNDTVHLLLKSFPYVPLLLFFIIENNPYR